MHPVDPLLEILGLSAIWQRRGPDAVPSVDETGAAPVSAQAAVGSTAPAAVPFEAALTAPNGVPTPEPNGTPARVRNAVPATPAVTSATASPAATPAATGESNGPSAAPRREAADRPVAEAALTGTAAMAAASDASAVSDTAPALARRAADDDDIESLDIDALRQRVTHCTRCRLCETRTKAVFGVGDLGADWMMIGEGPGATEDQVGEPFVGQAGKLLDNMLHALDLNRASGVFITNVVKCRPPGNRDPLPDEIAACAPYLRRQLALVQPKVLLALGRFAAQSLLQSQAKIGALRGTVHRHEGVPVIATYHPAYLLRTMTDKAKAWQDLCLARDTLRAHLAAQPRDAAQE
ncbi:MAG: uracil-DNA glycosylase family protein [Janthinobacterium lividum]